MNLSDSLDRSIAVAARIESRLARALRLVAHLDEQGACAPGQPTAGLLGQVTVPSVHALRQQVLHFLLRLGGVILGLCGRGVSYTHLIT